jgi:hypothetical protein
MTNFVCNYDRVASIALRPAAGCQARSQRELDFALCCKG